MKTISVVSLIVLAGLLASITIGHPSYLSDNEFLKDFAKSQVLNILAVIMTITIASIATIHIWFNELEEKHQKKVFGAARREINQAAFALMIIFLAQLAVLIIRSAFGSESKEVIAAFTSITILLVFTSVLTLWDIMAVVRALTPED